MPTAPRQRIASTVNSFARELLHQNTVYEPPVDISYANERTSVASTDALRRKEPYSLVGRVGRIGVEAVKIVATSGRLFTKPRTPLALSEVSRSKLCDDCSLHPIQGVAENSH